MICTTKIKVGETKYNWPDPSIYHISTLKKSCTCAENKLCKPKRAEARV